MSCFVASLRGEREVHYGCSGIAASHWERKIGTLSSCVNTPDGYVKGGN